MEGNAEAEAAEEGEEHEPRPADRAGRFDGKEIGEEPDGEEGVEHEGHGEVVVEVGVRVLAAESSHPEWDAGAARYRSPTEPDILHEGIKR